VQTRHETSLDARDAATTSGTNGLGHRTNARCAPGRELYII
jgi:hypothetical protein